MPQYGNQDYKNSVFQQLSQGSAAPDEDHFQHFENFSSGAPRRDVEAGVAPRRERIDPHVHHIPEVTTSAGSFAFLRTRLCADA